MILLSAPSALPLSPVLATVAVPERSNGICAKAKQDKPRAGCFRGHLSTRAQGRQRLDLSQGKPAWQSASFVPSYFLMWCP